MTATVQHQPWCETHDSDGSPVEETCYSRPAWFGGYTDTDVDNPDAQRGSVWLSQTDNKAVQVWVQYSRRPLRDGEYRLHSLEVLETFSVDQARCVFTVWDETDPWEFMQALNHAASTAEAGA